MINVDRFFLTSNCYIFPSLNILGIFISVGFYIVFLNIKFKRETNSRLLYNYIRLEVLFVTIYLTFSSARSIYFCPNTSLFNTYAASLVYYISRFLRSAFEVPSFVFHTLATLEFYACIAMLKTSSPKYVSFSKINYRIVSLIIFFLYAIAFSYRLFEIKIIVANLTFNSTNSTTIISQVFYKTTKTSFSMTIYFKLWRTIAIILFDALNVFILIALNILIFIRIRKTLKTKRFMQTTSLRHQNSSGKKSTKIENFEKSVKLMIFLGSWTVFAARIVAYAFLIFDTFFETSKLLDLVLTFFFLFMHYCDFLIYYVTNNLVRKTYNAYVRKLFNC